MSGMKKRIVFLIAVLAAALSVVAATVTEADVRVAATKFVTADPVGSALFGGRTVSGIRDADDLWIVSLAPAGHVIFSGSDLVEPIVGFSPSDFVDPDPDSPACLVLDGARETSRAAEALGAGARNAKWAKLLEAKPRATLCAGPVVPDPEPIIVQPFLQSHYSQWQPYNDYCPVYDSSATADADYLSHRGRSPGGCVATAAALTFRHFRWPVRIDQNFQYDHSFTDTNGITTTFPIQFDGHLPLDWTSLDDSYDYYNHGTGGYDLRGSVVESLRYPIARLVLWADVMAHMWFKPNGSSAIDDSVVSIATSWYTRGTWVDVQSGADQVKADMLAGVPCQISLGEYNGGVRIRGHQVVAHGWAEDASSQYVYINFGWGGENDGYYNVADDFQAYQEKKAYVGCYPRAKPQIEPLPKVCGPNITLNWHFPDFYNNNLSGFSIAVSKTATTPTTFLDDFSASDGVSTDSDIYVATDADGDLLYSDYAAIGTYTYPKVLTLTSASVLTFKVRSYAAISSTLEIQAKFGGEDWQTISTPALESGFSTQSWNTYRVYLGRHGGGTAQFRVVRDWGGRYYIDDDDNRVDYGYVQVDDFQVTDILEQEAPTIYDVTALERNFVLPRLDDGTSYSFTVTPQISSALVEGETSDPISCVTAGNQRLPSPGEQSYHLENLSFSASDASGVWSYAYGEWGGLVDASSVRAPWACSITATLSGRITTSSSLSFQWSAYNWYGDGSDTVSAVFISESGSETEIWSISNSADISSRQNVNLSLSNFAGQSGRIRIAYSHSGSAYTSSGGVLYAPTLTNIQVPEVPQVEWSTVMQTDLGIPAILSVSNVVDGVAVSPIREGFFRECKYGEVTVFDVECSEHVENLNAYSSHLALVGERQVTTSRNIDSHTFRVSVDASGISAAQSRSRLILTLEAIDTNGTRTYKDLSLRFSGEDEMPSIDPLEITTSALSAATVGEPYVATLEASGGVAPYTWSVAISGYGESQQLNSFSLLGSDQGQGWKDDDECWDLSLPFNFPFYGSAYSKVWVNSNGTLTFDGYFADYDSDSTVLSQHPMIAVLWKDLRTNDGDIYVERSSEAVTIQWSGKYYSNNPSTVSFSATLYADGTIRLCYGAGNDSGGMIGISSGNYNNPNYIISSASESGSMNNAQDIVFTPQMALPDGLSLSSGGVLSGTPAASGVEAVTVFVTDGAGTKAGRTFNLTIEAAAEPPSPPVVSPSTDPVIACESSADADGLADLINAAKETCIKAPEAAGLPDAMAAVYANFFDACASGNNVVIELNAAGTNALATAATNVAAQIAANLSTVAATPVAMEVNVSNAQPGFYYSVVYDNDLRTLGASAGGEGQRALANVNGSVALPIPQKKENATAGFYRVKVSVRATD